VVDCRGEGTWGQNGMRSSVPESLEGTPEADGLAPPKKLLKRADAIMGFAH
jgi:hypothetical protein